MSLNKVIEILFKSGYLNIIEKVLCSRINKEINKKWKGINQIIEEICSTPMESKYRFKFWIWSLSRNLNVSSQIAHHENPVVFYRSHIQGSDEASCLSSGQLGEIMRDVGRTFPDHPIFIRNGIGESMLANILKAVVSFKPKIGYCQGMNFVAGALLLGHLATDSDLFDDLSIKSKSIESLLSLEQRYFIESEVFWAMLYLLSNKDEGVVGDHGILHMESIWSPGFPKIKLRVYQFDRLFKWNLPELHHHFEMINLSTEVMVSQWFMTLFAYMFPLEYTHHIWDYLFLYGWPGVFKVTLALLFALSDKLIPMDLEQVGLMIRDWKRGKFSFFGPLTQILQSAEKFNVTSETLNALQEGYALELIKSALHQKNQIESKTNRSMSNTPTFTEKSSFSSSPTPSNFEDMSWVYKDLVDLELQVEKDKDVIQKKIITACEACEVSSNTLNKAIREEALWIEKTTEIKYELEKWTTKVTSLITAIQGVEEAEKQIFNQQKSVQINSPNSLPSGNHIEVNLSLVQNVGGINDFENIGDDENDNHHININGHDDGDDDDDDDDDDTIDNDSSTIEEEHARLADEYEEEDCGYEDENESVGSSTSSTSNPSPKIHVDQLNNSERSFSRDDCEQLTDGKASTDKEDFHGTDGDYFNSESRHDKLKGSSDTESMQDLFYQSTQQKKEKKIYPGINQRSNYISEDNEFQDDIKFNNNNHNNNQQDVISMYKSLQQHFPIDIAPISPASSPEKVLTNSNINNSNSNSNNNNNNNNNNTSGFTSVIDKMKHNPNRRRIVGIVQNTSVPPAKYIPTSTSNNNGSNNNNEIKTQLNDPTYIADTILRTRLMSNGDTTIFPPNDQKHDNDNNNNNSNNDINTNSQIYVNNNNNNNNNNNSNNNGNNKTHTNGQMNGNTTPVKLSHNGSNNSMDNSHNSNNNNNNENSNNNSGYLKDDDSGYINDEDSSYSASATTPREDGRDSNGLNFSFDSTEIKIDEETLVRGQAQALDQIQSHKSIERDSPEEVLGIESESKGIMAFRFSTKIREGLDLLYKATSTPPNRLRQATENSSTSLRALADKEKHRWIRKKTDSSTSNSGSTDSRNRLSFGQAGFNLLSRERLMSNRRRAQMVKDCRKVQLKVAKLTRALDVAKKRLHLATSMKIEALMADEESKQWKESLCHQFQLLVEDSTRCRSQKLLYIAETYG